MKTAADYPHPASYWRRRDKGKVQCLLCPFNCVLAEWKSGVCRGKTNVGGELIASNYGLTTSLNMDPMEKKPLYHFLPGSFILSAGPNGCNLACDFCQNFQVSQERAPVSYIPPERLAEIAAAQGSAGVAYTYAEPLIWFEYVLDAARAARARGLANVLVTNGFVNPEPLAELLPWIDAMNLDIKSMNPDFYRKVCKSSLPPVLETAKMASEKIHLEITNLLIPGLNDGEEDIEKLTDFVAELDPMIPLHFSRYFPTYKRTTPPTLPEALDMAAHMASRRLKYVYVGNLDLGRWNDTLCPGCGEVIVERNRYSVLRTELDGSLCRYCGMDTRIITRL